MKKSTLILLILIFICLTTGLVSGLMMLISSDNDENLALEELGEKRSQDDLRFWLTEGGMDWFIVYNMPSCYDLPTDGYTEFGGTRIHWLSVSKDGNVLGSLLESDPTVVFKGTLDGRHIQMTDFEFKKGYVIQPFKIDANFAKNHSSFSGTYTAQLNEDMSGCPAGSTISGAVNAKPM